ncbi:MAG: hypothetical protein JW967_11790 [Dehalococcoidales bacterium]|nr:hypothetical protein [Dehalococcoidales bacterium]
MKTLIWTIITVIIVAGVGFGGYQVYGMGYNNGEEYGYDSGYAVGEGAGYQSGQEDGYREGYRTGTDDGIVEGKEIGYAEGYDMGEQDGYESGYASGTQDGYQTGYTEGDNDGYDRGLEDGFGHGYTIKDPTWAEVLAFLEKDKTDEKIYDPETYVCSHFSEDVCNNAEDAGIRCAIVELRYISDQGHMIIAFNTIDRGMVYFEPQSDEQAKPAIGLKYYTTVIPKPGYYYPAPPYDDTIEDMVVVW